MKVAEKNLLRLSDEIGSDAVQNVIQLIHEDILKPDLFHQHIKDRTGCMEIIDGSVCQSLIHDGFQNTEEPDKTTSDDKSKYFLYRKDFIQVLREQLNIANDNEVMFRS